MASVECSLGVALSNFTADLYNNFIQPNEGYSENLIMSPVSIYTAFLMTMAGASGKTKQEMLQVLRVSDVTSKGDPHETMGSALAGCFTVSSDVDLSLANRLFLLRDVKIMEPFQRILRSHYNAEAESLTGCGNVNEMRKHINKWVSDKTKNKIEELLPNGSLDSNHILTIINAVYFRGFWEKSFDKAKTTPADFICLDGSTVNVQMMFKEDTYAVTFLGDVDARALKIPFKGTKLELLIVLPRKIDGIGELCTYLMKPGNLSSVLTLDYDEEKTRLRLPRFSVKNSGALDIKTALKACGMVSLFSDTCDLSGLSSDTDLIVDSIFHQALLEVDEEGATAAAATAVVMMARCALMAPDFHVNHPFFFALICNRNLPIFVGHVVKPDN